MRPPRVLGLLLDAAIHRRNPGIAATEDLVSLANPGHALASSGITLSVIGTLCFLLEQLTAGRQPPDSALLCIAWTVGCPDPI